MHRRSLAFLGLADGADTAGLSRLSRFRTVRNLFFVRDFVRKRNDENAQKVQTTARTAHTVRIFGSEISRGNIAGFSTATFSLQQYHVGHRILHSTYLRHFLRGYCFHRCLSVCLSDCWQETK